MFSGIPSVPVIISVVGGAGIVVITMRVDNFGVNSASEFTFIVSVFNEGNTADPIAMRMISPDSIDNPVITIIVDGLPQGMLVFTVASRNLFGNPSASTSISEPAVVQPS